MTIQIHTLDLTQGNDGRGGKRVIMENVPVITVWVPARLARGWLDQNQPGQASE